MASAFISHIETVVHDEFNNMSEELEKKITTAAGQQNNLLIYEMRHSPFDSMETKMKWMMHSNGRLHRPSCDQVKTMSMMH